MIVGVRIYKAASSVTGAGVGLGRASGISARCLSNRRLGHQPPPAYGSPGLSPPPDSNTKTSLTEFLDRTADAFFLTEIFRGMWLTFETAMKPKVSSLPCLLVSWPVVNLQRQI
jgi:hypothetical protein